MSDGFLHKYFLNKATLPVHKWLHYLDIYERHFERFRGKSSVMVEIGVSWGGSLAMWKEYLGEGCKIVGVDINPDCKVHEAEGIEIFIGSQDDPELMGRIFEKYPDVDIFLDDGSHEMAHMIKTFEIAYSRISPHGVYLVEDTHTCYWQEYNSGVGDPRSFMEFVKNRLDDINAFHTKDVLPVSDFTRSTDSISVYDSVVVFEKRPQGFRQAVMTYPMP